MDNRFIKGMYLEIAGLKDALYNSIDELERFEKAIQDYCTHPEVIKLNGYMHITERCIMCGKEW